AEEQAENYRKLLVSVAKDARVIIIKLADRLHNMRTLEHLDSEKQRRIALETREIYAPLAHRFGMAGVKAELEDLALKFLEPAEYRGLARQVRAKKAERERTIERLRAPSPTGTSRFTRPCSARPASCTRSRSAPARCTTRPSTASRRTGSSRRARAPTSSTAISPGSGNCWSCSRTPTRPKNSSSS